MIDKLLDIYAEIRIDATGFNQIYSRGAIGMSNTIGSTIKMLVGEPPNPIIENVSVTFKTRPKYEILKLKKVTAETKKVNDKLDLDISIFAVDNKEWTFTDSLVIDLKYLDKELHITSGEELANDILPNLKPDPGSIDLLNKISDRNALYVYYSDPENTEPAESSGTVIQLIFNSDSGTLSNSSSPPVTTTGIEITDEPTAKTDKKGSVITGWTIKQREYNIEILAKIEPPDNNHIVKGESTFTPKIAEQQTKKNKKRFWFF